MYVEPQIVLITGDNTLEIMIVIGMKILYVRQDDFR